MKKLSREEIKNVKGGGKPPLLPVDCFPWGDPICCGPCPTGGVVSNNGMGDVSLGNGQFCYCY